MICHIISYLFINTKSCWFVTKIHLEMYIDLAMYFLIIFKMKLRRIIKKSSVDCNNFNMLICHIINSYADWSKNCWFVTNIYLIFFVYFTKYFQIFFSFKNRYLKSFCSINHNLLICPFYTLYILWNLEVNLLFSLIIIKFLYIFTCRKFFLNVFFILKCISCVF